MTKSERERRAKEIIAESGADSPERVQVGSESINLGVTFRQQAEWFMHHVQTRNRKPVKPATVKSWENCVQEVAKSKPGQIPLTDVNNRLCGMLGVNGRCQTVGKDNSQLR